MGLKGDELTRSGMLETQLTGMELELTRPRPATIEGITHQWTLAPSKMNAYLMGPARIETDIELGVGAKPLGDSIMRYRWLTIGYDCHFDARCWMSANRLGNRAATGKAAATNCAIAATDRSVRQLPNQRLVRQRRARCQHDARRVFVESMNNTARGKVAISGACANNRLTSVPCG